MKRLKRTKKVIKRTAQALIFIASVLRLKEHYIDRPKRIKERMEADY